MSAPVITLFIPQRQVPFELSQKSGIGASIAGTSQQPSQETNTPATRTSKGKELETNIQTTKQSTMSKQPKTSKEEAQIHTPPTQGNVGEPSVLQTPLNEERNKKRDRETTTPASEPSG